jgi:NAD-dependent deacetylase
MRQSTSAKLLSLLQRTSHLAVLTGAGISAESGLPTFRGPGGLWRTHRAEELATPEAFARDPKLVWEWYAYRRAMVCNHEPNAGHFALAKLREHLGKLTLITQCVDGYHQQAGCADTIELHGNILVNRCSVCGKEGVRASFREGLPYCSCGELQRPSVVWFGENLPEAALRKAHDAAATCSVFMAIGTSAMVYPAAQLPHVAASHGAYIVEVNTETTALTPHVDEFLQGPAGSILPELLQALKKVSS